MSKSKILLVRVFKTDTHADAYMVSV